jgi:integrase
VAVGGSTGALNKGLSADHGRRVVLWPGSWTRLMGRPALTIGTYGRIRYFRDADGAHRARTQYRDHDGVTREVQRHGKTKSAAERALKEALRDRGRVNGTASDELSPESKVSTIAESWWAGYSMQPRSPGTLRGYRDRLNNQILPALGNVRARELSVGTAERFLRAVERGYGPSVAKMTRSVLSNVCSFAARHDAMDRNPVRDTAPVTVKPAKEPRALSLAEARQLRALLTYDQRAVDRDVLGLVDCMLITGLRIGEVLAITWPDVDLERGTIKTGSVVMRIRGEGLIIRRADNSKIKTRTLVLPGWGAEMLRRRFKEAPDPQGPVFCAVKGGLRDPSNTEHHLKDAFETAGLAGMTSHVLRKTVATLIKDAGLPSRHAADQLGHAQVSMTEDKYFGRELIVTHGAPVLERLSW